MKAPQFRQFGWQSIVAIAVLIVLAAAPVIRSIEFALAGWAITIGMLWAAHHCSNFEAKCLASFAGCWLAGHTLFGVSAWPAPMLLALTAFALVLVARGECRGLLARLKLGRFTPAAGAGALCLSALAVAALLLVDLTDSRAVIGFAEDRRAWRSQFWIACVTFSVANAAIEEFVWRFVGWEAARRVVVPAWLVISLQGLSFGVAHLYGVPSGWLGILLATAFGVGLGYVRCVSGGLLWPWMVHVIADVTIFVRLSG